MIVVDSSVWIDHFRGRRSAQVDALDRLLVTRGRPILVGDIVMYEVSCGLRSARQVAQVRRWFEPHRAILRKAAVDELWYWEADHAGRLWAHYCRYLRVERPRLLEFTWMSEATRGLESRVTVEMTPSRGATDLVLTHNGLPDDEMGRGHEEGWKHFTGILAEKIKGLR